MSGHAALPPSLRQAGVPERESTRSNPDVAASSASSSTFENRVDEEDEAQLFSPAEARSVNPVAFDASSFSTPTLPMGRVTASRPAQVVARVLGSRRERATDVHIENSVSSVPATPVQLAHRAAQHFDAAVTPTPQDAVAAGSPAQTPQQLINRYTRFYDSGVEASYHYVCAFINPGSGETGVAQVVLGGLRDELGKKRVMTLREEVFMNPSSLRLLIKQQAVIYHVPGRPMRQQRGTVVVCGGDGTMSFLMTQLDLVRRELEAEFQPFVTMAQQEEMQQRRDSYGSSASAPGGVRDVPRHPYFTVPALAPLPLGTGNDYSNCVGFGDGFSPSGNGWCGLCDLCGCAGDAGAQVAAALCDAVTAPCVSFDRWEVSLVPLRVAQAAVRGGSTGGGSSFTAPPRAASSSSAILSDSGLGASGEPASGAHGLRSPLWNRAARPTNVANTVNSVDWAKVHASGLCITHGLINYLGVGFDAYVTNKFDETRRAHPSVCSTRAQNKAVYGMMGLRGAFKCKKLRKIIPMVCVPRPRLSDARPSDGRAASPASESAGSAAAARDLVALQLPSMTKALVLTNVNCYSAGTHPWNAERGEPYYRPVTLRNGDIAPVTPVPASAEGNASVSPPAPTPRPVAINDRVFELQAMSGVLHYTSLGLGLSSSMKLIQTDEMFVFVLCTPDDLNFPSGQCSAYTQLQLKDKYEARIETDAGVRASLNVQIDGEAMPRISESTIIHVRSQPGARVLVRCRNANVVS